MNLVVVPASSFVLCIHSSIIIPTYSIRHRNKHLLIVKPGFPGGSPIYFWDAVVIKVSVMSAKISPLQFLFTWEIENKSFSSWQPFTLFEGSCRLPSEHYVPTVQICPTAPHPTWFMGSWPACSASLRLATIQSETLDQNKKRTPKNPFFGSWGSNFYFPEGKA